MAMLVVSGMMTWAVYPAEQLFKTLKRKANTENISSGEQDLENMNQSGMRMRPGHGERAVDSNSQTSTEGELTPISTEGSSQTEVSFLEKKWRQLSRTWSTKAPEMIEQENIDFDDIRGYNKILYENINDHTPGLGRLAAFTASDPEFRICRRFLWGFSLAIEGLQVEISALENQIRKSQREFAENDECDPRLLATRHKHPDHPSKVIDTAYWDLLDEHRLKLKQYADIIQSNRQMEALGKASNRSYFAVFDWIWGEQELAEGYIDFIKHTDDFVYFSDNHLSPFEDKIMEYMCSPPTNRIKKTMRSLYMTKDDVKKTAESPDRVSYYSTKRLRNTPKALVVCLVISVLLIPVYLLFLVPMSRPLMAVTATSFIVPVTFIASYATGAKAFELFVVTSTFGAVLIMFLGNEGQNGGA